MTDSRQAAHILIDEMFNRLTEDELREFCCILMQISLRISLRHAESDAPQETMQ